jgi:hypothetical protein
MGLLRTAGGEGEREKQRREGRGVEGRGRGRGISILGHTPRDGYIESDARATGAVCSLHP